MRSQRGAAMMVVIIMLAALLAAGAVAIHVQMSDTRSTELVKTGRDALYCAEAGLSYARPIVGLSFATWSEALDGDPANDPPWYPIRADLDGDGTPDVEVTLRDNDDERPPAANDPSRDNDLQVFMIARCLRFPNTPREVMELVGYQGGGALYRNQAGQGASNTGNIN